jgi:lysozyme family protein
MQHPFAALRGEYERLLATRRVTRPDAVEDAARVLLRSRDRYAAVSAATDVPIALLAALHWRESSADFRTNLAQGDPLDGPSIHVPAGRPKLKPGMRFPVTWEYAAIDAIEFDRLNEASAPWSLPYACWKGEAWNGFGPRGHGIHTGYLWAGTNHYVRGKYVADGRWNPDHVDRQIGIVPVMLRLAELDPRLVLEASPGAAASAELPAIDGPPVAPQRTPDGVGGIAAPVDPIATTRGLQRLLNILAVPGTPLAVDGSYGRRTREAVRVFQRAHGLAPDGLAGPITRAALARAEAGLD